MGWEAWRLDAFTWAWIAWILWFLVWETAGVMSGYSGTLTAHLRPVFAGHPLAWWLAVGAWLWLGVHLLAPSLETAIVESVGR